MNQEKSEPASQTLKNGQARVALIASERTTTEYSAILNRLLVGLVDESVPVALVCPSRCDEDSIAPPGVEVIGHPAFDMPLLWRQNMKILVGQLEKFKPTILHCLCESKAALTRKLAKQLSIPYILTVNSFQKRFSSFAASSKKQLARIVVPAETIAANIAEVHPKLVDYTVRINAGTFASESCCCFKELSRLATMVVAGPSKSVDEFEKLLGAIRHLAIDGYEFMLLVISSNSDSAERGLRKRLSQLGLSQMVTIIPRVQPWRSVLGASDIFIQPQPCMFFNPLILEAMSVGISVASCKGGVDDMIIEDKTAVIFDPVDELSIYGNLQRLLGMRDLARQIAAEAQENLRKNYTVSGMVADLLALYHQGYL